MRRRAKKVSSRRSNCKKAGLTVVAIVCILALIFVLLYFTNRPNYRDLQKEYQKISIPADWQLVSESSNKGTWGLFCLGVDDSSCPYINNEFTVSTYPNSASDVIQSLQKIVSDAGYSLRDEPQDKCNDFYLQEKEYVCGAVGGNNNIEFYVDLSSSDSRGESGSWASIRLSRDED
jgi:hypothetical protein